MLHYEQQAVSANDFPFLSLLQACNGSGTALQHAILTCAVKKGCLWSTFVGQSLCFNTLDCQFTLCFDYACIHTTVKINMYCVNLDCNHWTDFYRIVQFYCLIVLYLNLLFNFIMLTAQLGWKFL
jgi:hypothetical protein